MLDHRLAIEWRQIARSGYRTRGLAAGYVREAPRLANRGIVGAAARRALTVSRSELSPASGCSHCAASAASVKARMRNRPTRRSARASGARLLTRTAARVPARRASWARKKFTMHATKMLLGRAALRRSMRIRKSAGTSDVSRIASIASSHSAYVYGSMSSSFALDRPGKSNRVTPILHVLAHSQGPCVFWGDPLACRDHRCC